MIFILAYGCVKIMFLLLPTGSLQSQLSVSPSSVCRMFTSRDLELNTCGMLWEERDECLCASSKAWADLEPEWCFCIMFGWGEAVYCSIGLYSKSRGKVKRDLEQLRSLQLRQVLRYAQLKTDCLQVGASNSFSGVGGYAGPIFVSTSNLLHLTWNVNEWPPFNKCLWVNKSEWNQAKDRAVWDVDSSSLYSLFNQWCGTQLWPHAGHILPLIPLYSN